MIQENWKNKKVFALDISQERTGWALLEGNKVVTYGCIYRPMGFDGVKFKDLNFGSLLLEYFYAVYNILSKFGGTFDYIVMEDLNIRFAPAAKILMQFQAAAKLAAAKFVNEIYMINNVTVKGIFKIQRRKSLIPQKIKDTANLFKVKEVKIQMVQKINEMFNTHLTYDENDEADAIALAYALLHQMESGKIKCP